MLCSAAWIIGMINKPAFNFDNMLDRNRKARRPTIYNDFIIGN